MVRIDHKVKEVINHIKMAEAKKSLEQAYEVAKNYVKSPEGFRGSFEDYINPIWKYLTNGCNLNRDLEKAISSCGFEKIYLQNHQLSVGLPITIPNIVGYAVL